MAATTTTTTTTNKATLATALLLLLVVAVAVDAQVGKPGSCSPASSVQVCAYVCGSDFDCSGPNKCCPTACGGTVCSKPVTQRAGPAVKAGTCPAKPGGPWVCSSQCSVDRDCRGPLKCCRNRCGAYSCQRPWP